LQTEICTTSKKGVHYSCTQI